MITVEHKTPMARKEAWSYFRRCLAVMLCCVLVFGMTLRVQPRAQAVAVETATIIGGVSGGDLVGAAIGLAGLTAAGLKTESGYITSDIVGTDLVYQVSTPYEMGAQAVQYLMDNGSDAVKGWLDDAITVAKSLGGVKAGQSYEMPAEVMEAFKSYMKTHYGDSGTVFTNTTYVAWDNTVPISMTSIDFTTLDSKSTTDTKFYSASGADILHLGTIIQPQTGSFTSSFEKTQTISGNVTFTSIWERKPDSIAGNYRFGTNLYRGSVAEPGSYASSLPVSISVGSRSSEDELAVTILDSLSGKGGVLAYSPASGRLYAGTWSRGADGVDYVSFKACWSGLVAQTQQQPTAVDTTITVDPSADDEATPTIITFPQTWPYANVGGNTLPYPETWDKNALTGEGTGTGTGTGTTTGITAGEITGAITDALPITGTIAGDQVMEEVAQNPEGLGAVFAGKFPFCIPFDVIKLISLLAAEPVTPHFEVDFYAPLEGVAGFHAQGDTTIVVDFERFEFMGQVCRWTCLFGFVYALALGTKRLIWTA